MRHLCVVSPDSYEDVKEVVAEISKKLGLQIETRLYKPVDSKKSNDRFSTFVAKLYRPSVVYSKQIIYLKDLSKKHVILLLNKADKNSPVNEWFYKQNVSLTDTILAFPRKEKKENELYLDDYTYHHIATRMVLPFLPDVA